MSEESVRPVPSDAPEVEMTTRTQVQCDGGNDVLGHPLVYLRIGESGFVECPYCDKRFVLAGSAAT